MMQIVHFKAFETMQDDSFVCSLHSGTNILEEEV